MDDKEHLKLCLARYIYRNRLINKYMQTKKRTLWRTWWLDRFGDEYNDYIESVKK